MYTFNALCLFAMWSQHDSNTSIQIAHCNLYRSLKYNICIPIFIIDYVANIRSTPLADHYQTTHNRATA